MKIFYSAKCLEYRQENHPESPERVETVYNYIKDKGYSIVEPEPCPVSDLLLVHSRQLINSVENNDFVDFDTPNLPGMFDYAKLSAGGAINSMQTALNSENAFSLMRPPGHHAGRDFLGGFCYFNNIAIAVKKALQKIGKVAIIDIDGHHGNGTQDIFLGEDNVLYVSLHQKSAFPRTGLISEKNCLNYPLFPGTTSKEYMKTLKEALEKIEEFNADLVAVSAGFDTYKEDPLLYLELELETYTDIGKAIAELDKPIFVVLEGGYSKDMPRCVYNFLKGLG